MKIERVGLIHNFNSNTLIIKDKIRDKIKDNGLREDFKNPQLVIAIGGDGTFLKALKKTNYNPKILYVGINTGHLGFLQEISEYEIDELFDNIINQDYKIDKILFQEIVIISGNRSINYKALNEIVIREKSLRALELDIEVGANYYQEFRGDGIIISTPTGSTAHNMAYGGAVIMPNLEALQLLPMGMLTNTRHFIGINSPLIIPKQNDINIIPNKYFKSNLTISIDGESYPFGFKISKINVKLSNDYIGILTIKKKSYIEKLNEKFIKII